MSTENQTPQQSETGRADQRFYDLPMVGVPAVAPGAHGHVTLFFPNGARRDILPDERCREALRQLRMAERAKELHGNPWSDAQERTWRRRCEEAKLKLTTQARRCLNENGVVPVGRGQFNVIEGRFAA